MLTINNKLTKAFASGSLAIGVATLASLAGSTLLAPSAHGITLGELKDLGSTGVTVGDKKFYNFDFGSTVSGLNSNGIDASDTITFQLVADIYQVQWNAEGSVLDGDPGSTGFISYDVTITNPDYYFAAVAFDVDQNSSTTGVKEVTNVSPSLTAFNGNSVDFTPIPGHLKTISVKDTFTVNDVDGFVSGSTNKYKQVSKVPEPSAVLSLLALGGLGLVAKMRKQK